MNGQSVLWKILLVILLVALILAAADLLVPALNVLLLMFAGILFGIFLNGLIHRLHRFTPLSYRWGYVVVIALGVVLVAGGIYFTGSRVAEQVSALSGELRTGTQQLIERVERQKWAQQYMPDGVSPQNVVSAGTGMLAKVTKGVQGIVWAMTGAIVIFFVGMYMAYDPELYKQGVIKLFPQDRRERTLEVLHAIHSTLGYWIVARLISMTIVAVLTAVGLSLLKVPLAVPLGVLAGMLSFVPNIGPVLAAVPQALLALQVGTSTVLYVLLFNVILQAVESYLITPIVERYEVTLPPALTIFAQLLMGVLVGVVGVVMAAPLTATAMVLVQLLYIRDRLGDPDPGELAERR